MSIRRIALTGNAIKSVQLFLVYIPEDWLLYGWSPLKKTGWSSLCVFIARLLTPANAPGNKSSATSQTVLSLTDWTFIKEYVQMFLFSPLCLPLINIVFSQVTEEQIKLMRNQLRLEEEFNQPYLDLSLHQTVNQLILTNNHRVAEQMRKDFRIPDRR